MGGMTLKDLRCIYGSLKTAELDFRAAIQEMWPEGSRVRFRLRRTQLVPSNGTVVGHGFDGHLRIRLDNAKRHSRRPVRNIPWESICD